MNQIGGGVYDINSVKEIYKGSYQNNLKYYEDKNNNIIIKHVVYDINQIAINKGSIINEINGIPLKIITTSLLDKILFNNKDSSVTLRLINKNDTSIVKYRNNSNPIFKDVTLKIYNDSILYIKFHSFENGTVSLIKDFFEKDPTKIKHILIDIRECPGGLLTEVIKTIELFVEKGTNIGCLRERKTRKKYISENEPIFKDQSITIVTDLFTASGSEALAYSLRKFCNAKIIGERTLGYGPIHRTNTIGLGKYLVDYPAAELTIDEHFIINKDYVIPDLTIETNVTINEMFKYVGKK